MNQVKDWKKYTREQKIGTYLDARSWYGKVFAKLVLETKLSPADLYGGEIIETSTNREVKNWSKVERKRSRLKAIAELKTFLIRYEQEMLNKWYRQKKNILDKKISKLWDRFWKLDINRPQ